MNYKRYAAYLLDLFILIAAGASIYFLSMKLFAMHPFILIGIFAGLAIVLIAYEINSFQSAAKTAPRVVASALVLLNEAQRGIESWNLVGQTSVLLGKNIEETTPGIDLADTEYSSLIDNQHAVLNYTATGWIIEDLSSQNGVSILHPGKEKEQFLAPGLPYKILPGDILYIAGNTCLAVR